MLSRLWRYDNDWFSWFLTSHCGNGSGRRGRRSNHRSIRGEHALEEKRCDAGLSVISFFSIHRPFQHHYSVVHHHQREEQRTQEAHSRWLNRLRRQTAMRRTPTHTHTFIEAYKNKESIRKKLRVLASVLLGRHGEQHRSAVDTSQLV